MVKVASVNEGQFWSDQQRQFQWHTADRELSKQFWWSIVRGSFVRWSFDLGDKNFGGHLSGGHLSGGQLSGGHLSGGHAIVRLHVSYLTHNFVTSPKARCVIYDTVSNFKTNGQINI